MNPNMAAGRVWLVLLLLLALGGCAQTGDFGRKQAFAGGLFDQGNARSIVTDEERDMKNRMDRFVLASGNPSPTVSSSQNRRVTRAKAPQITDYYLSLRRENFADSRTRYTRIINDVQLDILTLPAVFSSICKVRETARRRLVAANNIPGIPAETLAMQTARRDDNNRVIAGFVAAISFRLDAYNFALEQLLVATPHEQARAVDAKLSELAGFVARGEAGQFCR